ncbi:MAG: PhoH family protein [Limnochordia bacterium]|jgi:phosphate starvation-inducible PhoH-like protein|nr:PhoH family protein [Limnochordia bacterium]MDI9465091.1 PhoH family protein [Bacillota bacterium]NLO95399.1 PhoH family protein [Bacillota bacterium]HAI52212.1 phosphate starvation-inducible protein PhoH [Bacillota bacterium]HAN95536.1 phosphate starvation-inducible protein PhoH [Bacillota bacterium]
MVDVLSQILRLEDNDQAQALSGKRDEHLRLLEEAFGVKIVARGLDLIISGPEEAVAKAKNALQNMAGLGSSLTNHDVYYAIKMSDNGESAPLQELNAGIVVVTHRGHRIRPKTAGQRRYISAMATHDIVFSIGPAGTGKTYLAMAQAVASLKKKEVERLVLTRPAVEAGEHLGFLPGDLQDKVDPYLRPLYDALFDILGHETFAKYREKGIIEIAPLAYMRGRTLDASFIILDEAQNCTPEQMKMFLTRLGFGSKAVITGDITQVDLPKEKTSGLIEVQGILRGVEGISFCFLDETDVVRHPLVQRIIQAYEAHDQEVGKLQS